MNQDELILAELRKISAWTESQRKNTKRTFIVVAILIPSLLILAIVFTEKAEKDLQSKTDAILKPASPRWYQVTEKVQAGDFEEAIRLGEQIIIKTPLYPRAHEELADAYLAAGRLEKAREQYAETFRLFPSEQNRNSLAAINRRIASETKTQGGPAKPNQPSSGAAKEH
jgi:tetratricopeptide (TPR) repeat protein